MTFEQIITELKAGTYRPLYFLCGDEPYFIDTISDYIEEHALAEEERDFNQTILYGKEADAATIIEHAKRFPMGAERQVVIVKEAQQIQKIEELDEYVKQPQPTTVLVICYRNKKLDKRKAFAKSVAKNGVLFEGRKLYEDKLPQWISKYVEGKGYAIDPKAAMMLTEHLGAELDKVTNELQKLFLNIPEGTTIDSGHIEKYIGVSKDYNTFELQNAIGNKNVEKANRIVFHFSKNEKNHPMPVTMAIFYNFFSKLLRFHFTRNKAQGNLASVLGVNPYFVKDYVTAADNYDARQVMKVIGQLREYDMRSKGVNNVSTSHGELLKELVYKIMH